MVHAWTKDLLWREKVEIKTLISVMPPQFKLFRIPALSNTTEEEELNAFLRSITPLTVHREFVDMGMHSYMLFTVEFFMNGKGLEKERRKKSKIDYREVLSPEDFALFAELRKWRKEAAGQEGIAVYTIFTNEQLAGIAENRPKSKTALQEIPGIGKAKTDKYGNNVIQLLTEHSTLQNAKGNLDHAESGKLV